MKYLTITSESFRHEVSAQVEVTNEVFHERSHALNGRNPSVELNQCNSRAFVHDEIHPRDGIQPLKPGSDLLTFFFQMYNNYCIRLGFEVVAGSLSFKSADSAKTAGFV